MAEDEIESVVEFSEDISDAEPPVPLPNGDYPAEIKAVNMKMSQRDTKYAAVMVYISPDDYPADYPVANNPDGITIMHPVGMEDNPQTRFRLRQFCEAIGAHTGMQVDVNDWVGLACNVSLDTDTWEGIARNKVKRLLAA